MINWTFVTQVSVNLLFEAVKAAIWSSIGVTVYFWLQRRLERKKRKLSEASATYRRPSNPLSDESFRLNPQPPGQPVQPPQPPQPYLSNALAQAVFVKPGESFPPARKRSRG